MKSMCNLNFVFQVIDLFLWECNNLGHCFERDIREPPRGLQLLLGTNEHPHMVDTIVMANLGYWQLKAGPGVWTLALAPGRSTELYTLAGNAEGTEEGPLSKRVIISDFRGLPVRLEVVKKRGMETEKILDLERDENDVQPSKVIYRSLGSFSGWKKLLLHVHVILVNL